MQIPRQTYDPVARAPVQQAYDRRQPSPEDFGGQLGTAVQQSTAAIGRAVADAQREADDTAVNDGLNRADSQTNKILIAANQRRGKDAFGLPKSVNEDFDKATGEVRDTLVNDEQKRMYDAQIAGRRVAVNRNIDAHVATQAAAYQDEVYNSGLQNALDKVGISYGDEAVVNATINDQVNKTERYAQVTGKSPEWTAQQHRTIVSTAHSEVINRFVADENTDAATQYFDRYKEELNAKDQQVAQAKLSGAVDMKKSQSAVDDLMAKPGDFNGGIGLQQGLDEIRDQYKNDPRAREMAERRWVSSYSMRDNAAKDENNATYNRILTSMMDPNNPSGLDNADMVDQANLLQRDPKLYSELSAFDAKRKRREETKTDPARWIDINELINNRPEEAKKLILTKEVNNLSTSDIKEFQGRLDKIGTGDGGTREGLIDKVANEELALAGQKPSDADKVAYMRAVRDAVNADSGADKPVAREKIQKIAGQLLADQVTAKGWVWNTTQPTYKIPEAVAAIRPGDGALPPDQVIAVTDALKDPTKRDDIITSIKSWANDPKTEGRAKQISDNIMAPAERFLGVKVLTTRLGRAPSEAELVDWALKARDLMGKQKDQQTANDAQQLNDKVRSENPYMRLPAFGM